MQGGDDASSFRGLVLVGMRRGKSEHTAGQPFTSGKNVDQAFH